MNIEEETKTLVEIVSDSLKKNGSCFLEVNPEVYHAAKKELEKKFKLPVVSKSLLWDFMKDPFGARWRAIDETPKDSEALRKGAIIDCLTLTPALFPSLYAVEEINRRTNAGKARIAELEADGKAILTPKEYDDANRVSNIARNEISRVCGEFQPQVACWVIIDEVKSEKLPCKVILTGMFDILPQEDAGKKAIVDLKTTSRSIVSEAEVNKNMAEYGYGVQAAIYTDLCQLAMGDTRPFAFLYVSLETPTRLRWVYMNPVDIEYYRAKYYQALHSYAACWKCNDWGDPVLPDMTYVPPAWEIKRETSNLSQNVGVIDLYNMI